MLIIIKTILEVLIIVTFLKLKNLTEDINMKTSRCQNYEQNLLQEYVCTLREALLRFAANPIMLKILLLILVSLMDPMKVQAVEKIKQQITESVQREVNLSNEIIIPAVGMKIAQDVQEIVISEILQASPPFGKLTIPLLKNIKNEKLGIKFRGLKLAQSYYTYSGNTEIYFTVFLLYLGLQVSVISSVSVIKTISTKNLQKSFIKLFRLRAGKLTPKFLLSKTQQNEDKERPIANARFFEQTEQLMIQNSVWLAFVSFILWVNKRLRTLQKRYYENKLSEMLESQMQVKEIEIEQLLTQTQQKLSAVASHIEKLEKQQILLEGRLHAAKNFYRNLSIGLACSLMVVVYSLCKEIMLNMKLERNDGRCMLLIAQSREIFKKLFILNHQIFSKSTVGSFDFLEFKAEFQKILQHIAILLYQIKNY